MANNDDITRLSMSNLGLSNKSTLGDWDKQVNKMYRSLQSATGGLIRLIKYINDQGQAIASFDFPAKFEQQATKVFDRKLADIENTMGYTKGSLTLDPYSVIDKIQQRKQIDFTRTFSGSKAKQEAKKVMESIGGTIESSPTALNKDRMSGSFSVSDEMWNNAVTRSGGNESKARRSLVSSYARQYLATADKYSRDAKLRNEYKEEEKNRQKEERAKEQEEKENSRKTIHIIGAIVAGITLISNLVRRILTATLARATEEKKYATEARAVGIDQVTSRQYRTVARATGMDEGIFQNAMLSLQKAFGNITSLDENALKNLAMVLQGDVIEAIQLGMGRDNPEKLMKTIIDAYYQRGQQGINSYGAFVGQIQAQRELASALEKAGLSEFATILREMFFTNSEGIYRGKLDAGDAFDSFVSMFKTYTMGLSGNDMQYVSNLGQVVKDVTKDFKNLQENLENHLLIALAGVIDKINNWNIGKSPEEKIESNISNRTLNEKKITELTSRKKDLEEENYKTLQNLYGKEDVKGVYDLLKSGDKARIHDFIYSDKKTKEFFESPEGEAFLNNLTLTDMYEDRIKKANENIIKGASTGKVEYQKAYFSDQAIASSVKESVESLDLENSSNVVRSILATRGATGTPFGVNIPYFTNEDMYAIAVRTLGKENGEITLDDILASKNYNNLLETAWDNKINSFYKGKRGNELKSEFLGKYSKGNKVKSALSALSDPQSGFSFEKDILPLFLTHLDVTGQETIGSWGISTKVLKTMYQYAVQVMGEKAEKQALQKLMEASIKDYVAKNFSNVLSYTVNTSTYDYKTGAIDLTINLKEGEKTITRSMTVDTGIKQEGIWDVKNNTLNGMTNNANVARNAG